MRDIFQDDINEEEQLIRTQWMAFIRSLIVFENVKWMNNPSEIFTAEIKPYQLYLAKKIGFSVPETIISNKARALNHSHLAIKSIDTAILNLNEEEGFVYTEIYKREDLVDNVYSSPFFIQQGLVPKTDIRVTVVRDKLVAIKIYDEKKIDIDWRRIKDDLKYQCIDLPVDITSKCKKLLLQLNLTFGGIDLIHCNDKYYFIEINPTGEWSWLQQNTGVRIDELIVDYLTN